MFRKISLPALIIILVLLLTACAGQEAQPEVGQPTVIEPGLAAGEGDIPPGNDEPAPEPDPSADPFPDLGEAATVADLTVAQAKITSYYFEQTVQYPAGHMFMQVWYKDGLMKVSTSVDGVSQSEFYYDYNQMTVVSYYPGVSDAAILVDFDPASPDAPQNPKTIDYAACTLLGTDTLDRQFCLILETPEGHKLWVGSKYGFPLQAEFADSLGDQYTVAYRNIVVNTVTDQQVLPPSDLVINNFSAGSAPGQ